ncbi:hypothetical protein PQX77_002089 [Marasmius sp. AFHP31]|nr:hypothetical protein PQX77_002089 [Marasmius sp. AFHP31]
MNRIDNLSNEIHVPIQDVDSGLASSIAQNDRTLGQDDEDYYPDAMIKGPGAIGLPLNNIQLDAIKRFCVEDEAGTSGTGGNTWIYPGEKVMEIRNPAWTSWLSDVVVAQLTDTLGASAKPILFLNGLKIRGPQIDTMHTRVVVKQCVRDAGQYAAVSIILPSPHMGGDINVSCGGVTKVFRTAKHSEISTMVIGSLCGADLILDQVDSGNVVSLEYTIACPSGTSPPRVPQLQHAKDCLQRAFHLWRQAVDAESTQISDPSAPKSLAAPNFYIYTLAHTYSALDLRKTSLRGCDQKLISLMEPLARTFRFDLHLASVKYIHSGSAYSPSKRSRIADRSGMRWDDSDLDSFDEEDDDFDPWELEMPSDSYDVGRSIKFIDVFTLDGQQVTMTGREVDRISSSDLDDEEQESLVINGKMYDEEPTDVDWERDGCSPNTVELKHIWAHKIIIITPASSPCVQFETSPEMKGTKKRSGAQDNTDTFSAKKPRV